LKYNLATESWAQLLATDSILVQYYLGCEQWELPIAVALLWLAIALFPGLHPAVVSSLVPRSCGA